MMNALSYMEINGKTACDVVAAPTHDDCLSLCRYLEKYWKATVVEKFDTGFAAKFCISMPNRSIILSHDSQTGNILLAEDGDIKTIIPDILADLERRLSQD